MLGRVVDFGRRVERLGFAGCWIVDAFARGQAKELRRLAQLLAPLQVKRMALADRRRVTADSARR